MTTLSAEQFEHALAQHIARMLRGDGHVPSFDRHTRLIEAGLIDSMGVLELIDFIQSTLGIVIPDEFLTAAHFASIARIAETFAPHAPRSVQ